MYFLLAGPPKFLDKNLVFVATGSAVTPLLFKLRSHTKTFTSCLAKVTLGDLEEERENNVTERDCSG
jgi:hypothetical protein